ncbi:MAG: phosphate ABC transporter permease subunit PstC, partial [Alphaproteobacteria bacterium]
MAGIAFALILFLALAGYGWNLQAARSLRRQGVRLHSLAGYHAGYAFLMVAIPCTAFLLVWLALEGPVIDTLVTAAFPPELQQADLGARSLALAEIKSIAGGRVFGEPEAWKIEAAERLVSLRQTADRAMVALVALIGAGALIFARRRVSAMFRARVGVERMVSGLMVAASLVAIFTTIGIIASLVVESLRFFHKVPITEFLFGLNWEPQIPLREDQIAAAGAFGWVPVLWGTLMITVIALVVAVPVGLMSAIYLNEFASARFRAEANSLR